MAMMDDLSKMLGNGSFNPKDLENLAKNAGIDPKMGEALLGQLGGGKIDESTIAGLASSVKPEQMAQITQMLGSLDLKNLDIEAVAKQFGIPADMVKQFLSMMH